MPVLDRAFALRKGTPILLATGGELTFVGDPLPANTILQEFAGVTPQPKHAELTTESLVSTTGDELEIVTLWRDTVELPWQIQLIGSGKIYVAKGYLLAPSLKWGSEGHTTLTYKAMLEVSTFQ